VKNMIKNLSMNIDAVLPLRDVVFNTLRQAILKGDLLPGERLMEIQLANKLGVSRTPIREAIRKLELEGLVVMIPRKGAIVAEITKKDLKDVLEVRIALEVLAIELACDRITDEGILKLEEALNDFENAMHSKDITLIAEKDVAFHDVIFNATNNERLVQTLNNLREQIYRYRLEFLKDFSGHERLKAEHRQVFDAIKERNKEVAAGIIVEHINNQELNVIKRINEEKEGSF